MVAVFQVALERFMNCNRKGDAAREGSLNPVVGEGVIL
jgi:hypothetical protein